jgi:hypothetical protein
VASRWRLGGVSVASRWRLGGARRRSVAFHHELRHSPRVWAPGARLRSPGGGRGRAVAVVVLRWRSWFCGGARVSRHPPGRATDHLHDLTTGAPPRGLVRPRMRHTHELSRLGALAPNVRSCMLAASRRTLILPSARPTCVAATGRRQSRPWPVGHARHAPRATAGVDRVNWPVTQVLPGAAIQPPVLSGCGTRSITATRSVCATRSVTAVPIPASPIAPRGFGAPDLHNTTSRPRPGGRADSCTTTVHESARLGRRRSIVVLSTSGQPRPT